MYRLPAGEEELALDSAQCIECPLGRYANAPSSVECEACPLGKYAHSEGNSECTACEKGRYNDVESQSVGCEESQVDSFQLTLTHSVYTLSRGNVR